MRVQYRYTGAPLQWADTGEGSPRSALDGSTHFEVFLLFEDHLASDASFEFDDARPLPGLLYFGIGAVTSGFAAWYDFARDRPHPRTNASVTLRTGRDGEIVAWSFDAAYRAPGGGHDAYSRWDGVGGEDGDASWSALAEDVRRRWGEQPGRWVVGFTPDTLPWPPPPPHPPPPLPAVPEPATGLLFGMGLLLAGWRARHAARRAAATTASRRSGAPNPNAAPPRPKETA
ncbi:MAG: PEP-CTERM sorting domain-containing protein [Comamonadaceae bacterium]|nr:PEP-CTERM sorting domain-containing protein [Comamonadaceae bacterium]